MLHVFFGNDTVKVRESALAFLHKNSSPDEAQFIDGQNFTPGILDEIANSSSLFAGRPVYVLDTPSELSEYVVAVFENIAQLAESTNLFVLIEGSILAPEKKQLTKHATSLEEYKRPAASRFNAFTLGDSLLKKDKRLLWVQLQEAYQHQLSAEEVVGTLWWQLKTLRLAALTKNAEEAGVKAFPYQKAKRALGNFQSGELERLSRDLLGLYHDGHAGKRDINYALEQWVLTL